MKTVTITSHELANKLLAGPNLPVFRFGKDDGDEKQLIPLSYMEEMDFFNSDEPVGSCIVVGAAISETEQPNAQAEGRGSATPAAAEPIKCPDLPPMPESRVTSSDLFGVGSLPCGSGSDVLKEKTKLRVITFVIDDGESRCDLLRRHEAYADAIYLLKNDEIEVLKHRFKNPFFLPRSQELEALLLSFVNGDQKKEASCHGELAKPHNHLGKLSRQHESPQSPTD